MGGHVAIHDITGYGGNLSLDIRDTYFGDGMASVGSSFSMQLRSMSDDVVGPSRLVRLTNCTFDNSNCCKTNVMLTTINLHMSWFSIQHEITIANVTFSNSAVIVSNLQKVMFIDSKFMRSVRQSALMVAASNVYFQGHIVFHDNTGVDGGAITICQNGKLLFKRQTTMTISGNHAIHAGGAIYVQPACATVLPVCFFQMDISDHPRLSKGDIQILIENNTAEYAGDALFGGSIDYCNLVQLL